MVRPVGHVTTVKIAYFAKDEFDRLVADLYTNGTKPGERGIWSARARGLCCVALRGDREGVKSAVSRYWE